LQSIRAYERIYTRYWQARVAAHLGEDVAGHGNALLRDYLHQKARAARELLLNRAPTTDDELTLADLRRPVGDTVRLRSL
jgi:hypothetical protein